MRTAGVLRALSLLLLLSVGASLARGAEEPAWASAWKKGPMNAEETKAFMKRLAQFVFDNHLKKSPNSPQRGMVYEYMDTTRKGEFDQFVQGEALDTMHDGAWLAAALVNAYRTTSDPFYKEFLTQWVLPFYLKMLNHSDELFSGKGVGGTGVPPVKPTGKMPVPPQEAGVHQWGKEWLFQEGEKGFVPYFWDDGGSVSLERRQSKKPLGPFQCVDNLAGKPNPNHLLDGYSLGSSNHMAQDLGVMLQLAWLMFRDSRDDRDHRVAQEIAEAARNLHECRMRHHGYIPMCVAPWALASGSAELMKRVPDPNDKNLWNPNNHCTRALYDFEPGKQYSLPGFADDQQYTYYHGIARAGGKLPKPLAFKTIYDAYTHPMLFRLYCDDWEAPPGINVFDLFPYRMVDGKPTDYRSERKGPHKSVKPLGSRFGPQNMAVCGWALQALKAYPGIWDERLKHATRKDLRPYLTNSEADVKAWLERELGCGLRTWEAVFNEKGYIPTSIGSTYDWDKYSDTGGYAHLISAAAQWLLVMEGKSDWEVHNVPGVATAK
ncbi:MAG: hypothetical protein FJ291_30995 [Planctomycetes bacterium]|nr:hypothetical protein [Planctomycetota bacterium]